MSLENPNEGKNLLDPTQLDLGPDTTIYMNNFTIFTNGSFTANTWSELVSEYGCIVAKEGITLYTHLEPNSYIVAWSVQGAINIVADTHMRKFFIDHVLEISKDGEKGTEQEAKWFIDNRDSGTLAELLMQIKPDMEKNLQSQS